MKQNQSELLFASMEHIDQDMIESAAAALAGKKKYGNAILKWSAVAAAVCVLVSSLAVFAMFRHTSVQPGPIASPEPTVAPPTSTGTNAITSTPVNAATPKPTPEKPFQLPTSVENIVWGEPEDDLWIGEAVETEWNGLWIDNALYEVLKDLKNESYVAIYVHPNDPELLNQFVYNGKTYQALQEEWDELRWLTTKLELLLKEGNELKYGDALYTTGVPGVGKWSEAFYQERVDYYGVDLLNRYIKDGEFLRDAVEADMRQAADDVETQMQLLTDANEAYLLHSAEEMYPVFAEKGYCVTVKNGSLYLFVQKDVFANLDVPNRKSYIFYLAFRENYEWTESATPAPTTPVITDEVSGLAVEKFRFEVLDAEHRTPKNDSEVVSSLNETIAMWQDSYDNLEIIFSCTGDIDQDCFKILQYERMQCGTMISDITEVTVTLVVLYENIDIEALETLSQMDEILYIHVWGPSVPDIPLPDAE